MRLLAPGGTSVLAEEIRSDVDAILAAAHEPALPATDSGSDAALGKP